MDVHGFAVPVKKISSSDKKSQIVNGLRRKFHV